MIKINKRKDKILFLYLPLTLMITWTFFPIYWTINTAFKNEGDILKRPLEYIPSAPTIENFVVAWNNVGFATFYQRCLVMR